MCNASEEANTRCLGIFDVEVKKFDNSLASENGSIKIPHMGWNTIYDLRSPLFNEVKENAFVYFVHSYYAALSPKTIATSDYIIPFRAAIQNNIFYGVQLHPENYDDAGIQIRNNLYTIKSME